MTRAGNVGLPLQVAEANAKSAKTQKQRSLRSLRLSAGIYTRRKKINVVGALAGRLAGGGVDGCGYGLGGGLLRRLRSRLGLRPGLSVGLRLGAWGRLGAAALVGPGGHNHCHVLALHLGWG